MRFILALFVGILGAAIVHAAPFCAQQKPQQSRVIAYLGADTAWSLNEADKTKLQAQLAQVSLVNYSFVRLAKDDAGNTILKLSAEDLENIQMLRLLKPNLPIMIAVGGWGEREGFTDFLKNEAQRQIFVDSVHLLLDEHHLDGIDLDWENELLAGSEEIQGVALLLNELHESLNPEGYCVSNAVPGTSAYWKNYPKASLWQKAVDWTTIMSYDHYGTFGPKTELAAALYDTHRLQDKSYPYPTTSGDKAVKHYFKQGLPAQKIILGMPFYCHSYYLKNSALSSLSAYSGLQVPVLDPNISSQVSYNEAYNVYGEALFAHQQVSTEKSHTATSYYGLISVAGSEVTRFMSCDSPKSIADKMAYVEGANFLSEDTKTPVKLGGVSFWSLQQDLPYSNPHSLLRAIHQGLNKVGGD